MSAQQVQELAARLEALVNQNAEITSELNEMRRRNQTLSQQNAQVRAEATAANQRQKLFQRCWKASKQPYKEEMLAREYHS